MSEMNIPVVATLTQEFDVERLKHDLKQICAKFAPRPHYSNYHDGGWTGIALRSASGEAKDHSGLFRGACNNTPALDHAPYLRDIIDNFVSTVGIARLLFLEAGKRVGEHRDSSHHWQHGLLRLHIPIITHEDVHFKIADEKVHWQEGKLYFGDFSQVHSVSNDSPITRVHLVIDVTITDSLLNLFPQDTIDSIRSQTELLLDRPKTTMTPEQLEAYSGYFAVPAGKLPLFLKRPYPLIGEIKPDKGQLQVRLLGIPLGLFFAPESAEKFTYLGYEISFFGDKNDQMRAKMVIPKLNISKKKHSEQSMIDSEFTVDIVKSRGPYLLCYSYCQTIIAGAMYGFSQVKKWIKRLF